MTLRSIVLIALLPLGAVHAAKVNIVERAVNDADGSTIGAVSQNQFIEIGNIHTTVAAPVTWSSYRFTHWTFDGEPATVYRDPWGRSSNPVSFQVSIAATATAHYVPSTRDSDSDSLPDWYEIEHFGNLDHTATSDTDGDGVTLLAEYTGNTSPLYANATQAGGVVWVDSALVTCNLAGYPTYTLRSMPAGTVNQTATVPPGTVVTTPDLAGNASFGYWTLDGVRQADPWGRALSVLTFTVGSQNRDAVAWMFTGDSDSDSVPDAYEQRMYGSLGHAGNSDTDGDGITLLAEYTGNTSPLYANTTQTGGVVWVDSALVTCNLTGYPTYTLRSVPAGTVNQTATVPPGTVVTTPDLTGNASFGYWTLDGVRQADPWGRALSAITFTMGSQNRDAVAWMFTSDSDSDSVPDAYEQRMYGTLGHGGNSDTDGDGITLLAEYTGNSSPLYANATQAGGVVWTDSALVTTDLQAIILVRQPAERTIPDDGNCGFDFTVPDWETLLVFTIHNPGGTDLTGISATIEGTDAGMFTVTSAPATSLSHNQSCQFTVKFRPSSAGSKTAVLRIVSNAPARNPYEIHLTGDALFSDQDADEDGMNDASEFRLAAMGFNWQQPQTDLVNTYYTHAGLNGLYTRDQVRAIRISKPRLEKIDGSGQFKMSVRLWESADLKNYSPLPLQASALHVNEDGRLECEFSPADTEAFYWLESE